MPTQNSTIQVPFKTMTLLQNLLLNLIPITTNTQTTETTPTSSPKPTNVKSAAKFNKTEKNRQPRNSLRLRKQKCHLQIDRKQCNSSTKPLNKGSKHIKSTISKRVQHINKAIQKECLGTKSTISIRRTLAGRAQELRSF